MLYRLRTLLIDNAPNNSVGGTTVIPWFPGSHALRGNPSPDALRRNRAEDAERPKARFHAERRNERVGWAVPTMHADSGGRSPPYGYGAGTSCTASTTT